MKCHKTIVLFALDSYLSTLLFVQRFLSLVEESEIFCSLVRGRSSNCKSMQQMTRYWRIPILMQVNRECFTNYFHSSKETQISTNLQILDRFPPVGRPVTCSNDPSTLQKFPPPPRKQFFIDLRKIDRFLFFPSLSFFPTL